MKEKVFALLLMAGLPFAVMAQSNDDLYFVPKKEKKVEKTTVVSTSSKEITKLPEQTASTPAIVVKDKSGRTRDVDEYNRRYTSKDYTFKAEEDALVIEEKPYEERGEWIGGFDGSDSDYEYAPAPWVLNEFTVGSNKKRLIDYQLGLHYDRTFADKHTVTGLFLFRTVDHKAYVLLSSN